MARTFLSQLVAIVHRLCTYINKYQSIITPALNDTEKAIFLALVAACTAFMQSSIVTKAKND